MIMQVDAKENETQVQEIGLKAEDAFDRRKWRDEAKRTALQSESGHLVNVEKPGFLGMYRFHNFCRCRFLLNCRC